MRASIAELLNGQFDGQGNLIQSPESGVQSPGSGIGREGRPERPFQGRRNALAATEEAEVLAMPAQDMARIAELRRDGDTQPRGGLNEDRVKEYMEAKREGIILPAVKVCFDGKDKWLWDGFHRVEAHLRLGLEEIAVSIQRGSKLDAQWLSCAANKEHGLNRTQEDKERAVRKALAHPNGATKSNRDIARHVGVDEKTVRKYRAEMESTAEIPQLANREVQRGNLRYQLPTGKIGSGKTGKSVKKAADTPATAHSEGPRAQLQNRKVEPDRRRAEGSRYVLPLSRYPNIAATATSSITDAPTARAPLPPSDGREATGRASQGEGIVGGLGGPEEYASIFLLEQRVWVVVRAMQRALTDPVLLVSLRSLTKDRLTFEVSRLGEEIVVGLAGLAWRKNDLMQAINNVASQLEQPDPYQGKVGSQQSGVSGPQSSVRSQATGFRQETVPPALAATLAHSERRGAIDGEVAFWKSALLHVVTVGELTGQHVAVLPLRREIERVIGIYLQEQRVPPQGEPRE